MPGKLQIACPNCRHILRTDESVLNRKARCAHCNHKFIVTAEALSNGDLTSVQDSLTPAPVQVSSSTQDSSDGGKSVKLEPTLRRVGRFDLKALLGEGAYGVVYRAWDNRASRTVALKLLRFPAADERQVQRFLTEARAAARLSHPNLVAVYEAGEVDGEFYIAFEYIAGTPLSQRIADEKLSLLQIVTWVRELAAALAVVHAAGVIHRDIKSSNILIDEENRPRIADFGLAKSLNDDATQHTLTEDGNLLGTPAYMSPEQARGDAGSVGPHSDQYSLGVVLYELLTGRRPFEGPPHVVISQVATANPPAPRTILPWIPADLEKICLKALAKHPALRYADMSQMTADFDRWLAGQKVTTRTTYPIRKRVALLYEQNRLATVLSAAVLVLGVSAGGLTYGYFQMRTQREVAVQTRSENHERAIEEAIAWATPPEPVDGEPYGAAFTKWIQDRGGYVSSYDPQQNGVLSYSINFPSRQVVNDRGLAQVAKLISDKNIEAKCSEHLATLSDRGLEKLPLLKSGQCDLGLSSSSVTDAGLASLSRMLSLHSLHLGSTSITDQGLEQIKDLTAMKSLDLSGTHITADGLRHLRRMEQLTSLMLYQTHVVGGGEHLRPLRKLTNLYLQNSHLSDQDLAAVGSLPKLVSLDLSFNSITDDGCVHLQNLTHCLQYLRLAENSISDTGCIHLQQLSQLESLSIGDKGSKLLISDAGLAALATLPKLRELELWCRVTDSGIDQLQELKQLEALRMFNTRLTPQGTEGIARLPRLQQLHLVDDELTADGVRKLAQSESLRQLFIQSNKLKSGSMDWTLEFPQLDSISLNYQTIIEKRPQAGAPGRPF